jgi:YbgC/YbaW family acyl-CoA thioester hydrolase
MNKTHKDLTPEKPPFSDASGQGRVMVQAALRFSDMDANGHLFFGNYFTLFDTAFLEYLDIIGFPFDMFGLKQLNFYYVEATTQYKTPVKYGDTLDVAVWIESSGRTSFTIQFEAVNKTCGKVAATGRIVAVVVDEKTEKPAPLPEDFKQRIERSQR